MRHHSILEKILSFELQPSCLYQSSRMVAKKKVYSMASENFENSFLKQKPKDSGQLSVLH
jgi:hypothetical protein